MSNSINATVCDATATTVPGWQQRLAALIEARRRAAFGWGNNDCCIFVADAVLAQTGADPAADLRGSYATEAQAQAVLGAIGGLDGAGARCGTPVPALCAQFGDVGIVFDGEREALGLCTGEAWLVPTARGLAPLPFDAARRAWRVARG